MRSVGIRSLAVCFPELVRGNELLRCRFSHVFAQAEEHRLAEVWSGGSVGGREHESYDESFRRFLDDPFRGTVERRVLAPEQRALELETAAAERALQAAELSVEDVGIILVCSFQPDQPGIGNAVFLARELGTRCPAWNLEAACSSATVGLRTAAALLQSEEARHVLVVVSTSYSRTTELDDTFGWFLGDGCAAFVVGPEAEGRGVLGSHMINTSDTCGTFWYSMVDGGAEGPRLRIENSRNAGSVLRRTAAPTLVTCARGAATSAGVELSDIDFFVFNTPTAWYSSFCVETLGIDPERTIDLYPRYANTGPCLWPTGLHHAATDGRIAPDDLVLVYSVGSVSLAGAVVMRWGDVGLGPMPGPGRLEE